MTDSIRHDDPYEMLRRAHNAIDEMHEKRVRAAIATALAKMVTRDEKAAQWVITDQNLMASEHWPELVAALKRVR